MKKDENSENQLARDVGSVIAGRRKAKGLTQSQLAEQMGIEKETVSRMETGHISPTLGRLAQLAKLLDCEVSDLLQIGSVDLNDHALSLVNRMEALTESQQAILVQLFGKVTTAMVKLTPKERKAVESFLNGIL